MFRSTPPVTLWLERGHVLAWNRPIGTRLRVLAGTAWVTQANDPQDHFLRPGQTLAPRPGSLVVVQAEQDLRLGFEAPGEQSGWAMCWRLIRDSARAVGVLVLLGTRSEHLEEAHAGLP